MIYQSRLGSDTLQLLFEQSASDRAPRSSRRPRATPCGCPLPPRALRPAHKCDRRSRTVDTRCEIRIVVRPRMNWPQAGQNAFFRDRIHRCQGVVENQDLRVPQHRARDRRALLLSARQRDAALAHNGLEARAESPRCHRSNPAMSAARRISASLADSTPNAMLPARVELNRNVSCGTNPIRRRNSLRVAVPQIDAAQPHDARSLDRPCAPCKCTSVDLPLPGAPHNRHRRAGRECASVTAR